MTQGPKGTERKQMESPDQERLEELLRVVPRVRAPSKLWQRVARSLSPEAVAGRRLARRRWLVAQVAVVAATLLLVVAGWWFLVSPYGPYGRRSQPAGPQGASTARLPEPAPVTPPTGVGFDQELATLGEVHLVYEAGNVLPEEMVLTMVGEGNGF